MQRKSLREGGLSQSQIGQNLRVTMPQVARSHRVAETTLQVGSSRRVVEVMSQGHRQSHNPGPAIWANFRIISGSESTRSSTSSWPSLCVYCTLWSMTQCSMVNAGTSHPLYSTVLAASTVVSMESESESILVLCACLKNVETTLTMESESE